MKKIFLCATIAVAMCFASCEKFDASEILDRLDNLENQTGEGNTTENNKIYYTSSGNTKLFPKTDASLYGAILISNTYKDGQGVLVFDDVVISIGDQAFSYCGSLTSVTIPDSVTSIGNRAFEGCLSLKEIYCKPTTPPYYGLDMFLYTHSTLKVYVPRDSLEAYKTRWSYYASYIVGYDF